MRAAVSPNETGDRTGALNLVFRYVYSVRLLGKQLKTWNRTVYYIVKWCLFVGIFYAIFRH